MRSPHLGPWRSWLGRFRAILLDMHGTFMFGHDRFLPDTDFWPAYAVERGAHLDRSEVNRMVRALVAHYGALYGDPAWRDAFPSVVRILRELHPELPEGEIARLEAVIAAHEVGRVSKAHAEAIRRLARTHRLGVVSNLWSRPGPWRAVLAQDGLEGVFEVTVFSSDHDCIKPSPRLFGLALAQLDLPVRDVLFIGDDIARDVAGAKQAGMAALWIGAWPTVGMASPLPDGIVQDLCELLD
jgi:HAD superfamily hydrolase (TIGR01549 family)